MMNNKLSYKIFEKQISQEKRLNQIKFFIGCIIYELKEKYDRYIVKKISLKNHQEKYLQCKIIDMNNENILVFNFTYEKDKDDFIYTIHEFDINFTTYDDKYVHHVVRTFMNKHELNHEKYGYNEIEYFIDVVSKAFEMNDNIIL